jgi:aspartyl-tRNA(Asn)/glutamyl-tRNA(Gln) amidotransferase subunit C
MIHMGDSTITPDAVRHVAKLARLDLTGRDVTRIAAQLESIVTYINQIGQADVAGVEPMAHALPVHNVFRDDIVGPSLPLEKVLQNAPDSESPFFRVPKIIGGEEDSAG